MSSVKFLAPSVAVRHGQRQQSRRDAGATNVKDARLKAAATNSKSWLRFTLRTGAAGSQDEMRCGAIHHGTLLIQPIQMASERARARITAQLSRESSGDAFAGLPLLPIFSVMRDAPWVRVLRNLVA
jgi:hypothetical protein